MGGAPLLLALAVVTADVGWEPDGSDGYRYIIQVPAEQLADAQRMSITSEIPVELRGRVSSIIVRVGDDPLPQPKIVAPTPATSAADELAADTSVRQTAYPSPPDTVRAQGGENEIRMPGLDEMQERARRAAEQVKNGASSQLNDLAAQAGERAQAAIDQSVENVIDATSNALRETANQTVAAGSEAARNMMSSTAPSTNPSANPSAANNGSNNSGAAANSFGRSNFSGFQTPPPSGPPPTTNGQGASSAYSPIAPSTSVQPPAAPSPASAGSPSSAATSPGIGQVGGPPPSTGVPPARSSITGIQALDRDEGYRTAQPGSTNTMPPSDPPSVAGGASGTPAGGTASPGAQASSWPPGQSSLTPNNRQPTQTAEEQQREQDAYLLSQVGFENESPYDKKSGDYIYPGDPRWPQIQSYLQRRRAADAERQRTDQPLSAAQQYAAQQRGTTPDYANSYSGGANGLLSGGRTDPYDPRGGFSPPGGAPVTPSGYDDWRRPLDDRYASNAGRPAGPGTATGSQSSTHGSAQNPAQAPLAGTSGGADPSRGTDQAAPPQRSPSDGISERPESSRSQSRIEPQPFYNSLLLLSIVINVYLGIAISRLLTRYRNLVATHRGTAATA